MNKKIIGKCSQCGGIVSVPTSYHSTEPPVPQCEKCGAAMDVAANLPVVPTIPVTYRQFRNRLAAKSLVSQITVDNSHPLVDFGPPVGNEII